MIDNGAALGMLALGSKLRTGMTDEAVRMAFHAANKELVDCVDRRYGARGQCLPFHNKRHTVGVRRRTNRIPRAMGLPEIERLCAALAAAGHDVVQVWWCDDGVRYSCIRTRDASGRPERLSAEQIRATAYAHGVRVPERLQGVVFGQAFAVTEPSWDIEVKTVMQPHLFHDTHPIACAVALADLNGVGMEGSAAAEDTRRFFCELYPGSVERRDHVHMLAWLVWQRGFVLARKERLEIELGNLNGPARDRVVGLFTHFNASYARLDRLPCMLDQWPYADLYAWYAAGISKRQQGVMPSTYMALGIPEHLDVSTYI